MYLNNHTYYSLRYGTLSEEELLNLASERGFNVLPITDINNTSGCLNFIRKAPEYNIRPIVGIDFRNGADQLFIALAKNNEGFHELNNYLSKHLHTNSQIPPEAPMFSNAIVIYPFEKVLHLDKLLFNENEYIGINTTELNKLRFSRISEYGSRLVALNTVTFKNKRDYNIHRLLRAIDNNTLLSKLDIEEQGKPNDRMLPLDEIRKAYSDYPHIIKNTEHILNSCNIEFDFSVNKPPQNQKTFTETLDEDFELLKGLCNKGVPIRYPDAGAEIHQRIDKELNLIKKKDFVSFFLINWRIIQYAKSKDYFYIGRGSGANSIVAYLLEITDVDPIELDLYFERFMNLYRSTPPDFDIDFSTWDREDITRFIFDEFGKNKQVALLGAYVTFKHSGAVRELGKVFGLPKEEIDKLSKGKFNINKLDQLSRLVLKYSGLLHGRPNYVSIHAAGILISERPIHYFSATNLPPKGFPTVQFDMHIAEDIGLYKFDILGQRGLGKIKDAIGIIKENNPYAELLNIHYAKPLFVDENINEMISKAECIGCFYVESPAMRMLLKKIGVKDYLTLVAASSIIRPGVSKSGMMREYILRHKNPERRKRAHPVLWDIMPDTYGVMVYQEDVIKVAHYYGGLDLGEADVLRRGMSGKYRSRKEFQLVKQKFMDNCKNKGEATSTINEIWRQIESFAGYAFAKGHSASYAVESYQSLYLKCYYPLEYMVATLNNGGGFYNTETYVHEARKHGGVIHAPCINNSQIITTIRGKDIYLGFQHLKGLDKSSMVKIINTRTIEPFISLDDFIERVPLGIEQMDILIRINAFRSTGKDKRSLLWEAYVKENKKPVNEQQVKLFRPPNKSFNLPSFNITNLESAFDQLELIGFPLFDPFILLRKQPKGNIRSSELLRYRDKTVQVYGYLVTVKNTSTSKGDRMYFGTFLDKYGDWIDTVHFPPVAKKHPFRGKGIYMIIGKVVEEFDCVSIEVSQMERMDYVSDPRFDISYDSKSSNNNQLEVNT